MAPEARGDHPSPLAPFRQTSRIAIACLAMFLTAPAKSDALVKAQGEKPAFTLSDSDSKPYALATQRGRTVLVHFFATWCEPCREELPALRRLVERSRDHQVSVVAI